MARVLVWTFFVWFHLYFCYFDTEGNSCIEISRQIQQNVGQKEKKNMRKSYDFDQYTIRSHRERGSDPGATFWVWHPLADATLFARRAQEATRWPQGRIEL